MTVSPAIVYAILAYLAFAALLRLILQLAGKVMADRAAARKHEADMAAKAVQQP